MKTLVLELIAFLKTVFIGVPIIAFIIFSIFKDSRTNKNETGFTNYRQSKNYKYFKKLNRKKMKVENDINARTNKKTKTKE